MCAERLGFRTWVLLVGLSSTVIVSGQNRYSMNVVGYYDAQFVAGSNLVANPFNAGNNAISNVFAGVPEGSVYLGWSPVSGNFGPTNKLGGGNWTDGSVVLDRRSAGFLCLPASANVSFTGEVWPATCISFPPGPTASGVLPIFGCGLLIVPHQTQVVRWDRVNQRWDIPLFYIFEIGWEPAPPTLVPDEAAIIDNPSFPFMARSSGPLAPAQVPLLNPVIEGTNFVFEFSSLSGMDYVVQSSLNPDAGGWRTILSKTATSSGAYTKVVIPMDVTSAFFRLYALRLVNPVRTGTQFRFDFYAEQGTRYRVSRSPSLENPAWQTVTEVDGTGGMMTATDSAATARGAYYRLEY